MANLKFTVLNVAPNLLCGPYNILTCSLGVRFRASIKDLEVMMQNAITLAFETVTTVEQGVEILDVFMHLSTREVGLLSDR